MLDDILFSTQLLITHLITTFSVGDNHDILGIYLTCGPQQQNVHAWVQQSEKTYSFSFLEPLARAAYLPWLSWWSPTENVATEWLTNGLVAHNVTKHVMVAPIVLSLTSDHHSRVRDADIILFHYIVTLFVLTMSVTFCRTDYSKKKSWHSDWPSDGRKNVTKHALITPIGLSITSDYHNRGTWCWHELCFSQIFYDIDSYILQQTLSITNIGENKKIKIIYVATNSSSIVCSFMKHNRLNSLPGGIPPLWGGNERVRFEKKRTFKSLPGNGVKRKTTRKFPSLTHPPRKGSSYHSSLPTYY